MYDIDSMKEAIKKCDVNIKTFEKAIDNEHVKKREYNQILQDLIDKKSIIV